MSIFVWRYSIDSSKNGDIFFHDELAVDCLLFIHVAAIEYRYQYVSIDFVSNQRDLVQIAEVTIFMC